MDSIITQNTDIAVGAADAQEVTSVSVIGLGYIGLPTAAMFASSGLNVYGVDVSARVVEVVNAGGIHIEEGNLDVLVAKCVKEGRLSASLTPRTADVFIVAVPTPVGHDAAHMPDVSYVEAAGRAIAPVLKKGDLVILESTSPVGTTGVLARLLADARHDLSFPQQAGDGADVQLAYCPERIIPGRMLQELVENDRIIGGMSRVAAEKAADVYKRFVKGTCYISDDRTAEMVKLTENAFRDVNIAFANELSMICDKLGIDVWQVIGFANRHPRVSILNPGPGVGGHCIAVDPWFIVAGSPEEARLIRKAREVNDAKPEHVVAQVAAALQDRPGAKIVCFGLSYKPDVDDFRESPSLDIASALSARYPGRVSCCDPYAHALPELIAKQRGLYLEETDAGFAMADVVVMLVGHSAFRGKTPHPNAAVIDTVGFWK